MSTYFYLKKNTQKYFFAMLMKEKQKNDKNMYGIVHACVQAKNKELGQMHFGLCMLSKLFCITHIFSLGVDHLLGVFIHVQVHVLYVYFKTLNSKKIFFQTSSILLLFA